MLLCERGPHRPQGLNKSGPRCPGRATAACAPQDTRADGALRRLVRGRDAFNAPKGPPRVLDLAHLPTDACRRGNAPGLTRVAPPRDRTPERTHGAPDLGVRAPAIADAMPRMQPLPSLRAQALAKLRRPSPALAPGCKVPQQMRPAAVPPPGGIPRGGAPAVRHQEAAASFPHQRLRDRGAPRQADATDAHPGRDGSPQPRTRAACTPARFLQRGDRGGLHLRLRLGDGGSPCLPSRRLQRRQGAETHRQAAQVVHDPVGGALRQVRRARAQGHDRLPTRAQGPREHPHRAGCPRAGAPRGTAQAVHRRRGDDRRSRGKVGDLRPGRLGVISGQGLRALRTLARRHGDESVHRCHGSQRPRLPCMPRVPAGLPALGCPAGPWARRVGRSTRWGARRGARVLLKALQHTLDSRCERRDARCEGAEILVDSNGRLLPQRRWEG
jgi:hypothetical protein